MKSRLLFLIMILLVAVTLFSAAWAYPFLPEKIVSHWNVSGEPDGYMSKWWGTFLLPILLVILLPFFWILPKIDPFKKNIAEFQFSYNLVLLLVVSFLSYLHFLSLAWNLGNAFDFVRMLAPALGILFLVIGVVLPRTKRNWFLGIRTPWTLSSDSVWEQTHKVGGVLFVFSGAIIIVSGVFAFKQVFVAALVLAVVSAFWSLAYSYILYRREQRDVSNEAR